MKTNLSMLPPGALGTITELNLVPQKTGRLLELGVYPGAVITYCCAAPSGSPMIFWIKDALIALRKQDCLKIGVEPHA